MRESFLNIAIGQLRSIDDEEINYRQIDHLLKEIESQPVDLVCFPENALFFQLSATRFSSLGLGSPSFKKLNKWVQKRGVRVLLGGVPLRSDNKYVNAAVYLEPKQNPRVVYEKIHLFDVEVGDYSFKESQVILAGSSPSVLEVLGWKIGLSICYDLRFSELYTHYSQQNVDIMFAPSAFTRSTGRAHWHILNRARAIESQCYMVSPAQSGIHKSLVNEHKRTTYGHSLVVGPWGEVILDLGEKAPQISIVRLESKQVIEVRNKMPMSDHRRLY